jgi:hypothetical protein
MMLLCLVPYLCLVVLSAFVFFAACVVSGRRSALRPVVGDGKKFGQGDGHTLAGKEIE